MSYDPKVTSSKVNDYYFDLLHHYRKKVLSLCSEDTHLLTLNMYLDSPYYEVIQETPAYTFDTLISNIGGSLGLFIGVSIISIVELFEFIIDIVLLSMRMRKGRIRGEEDQAKVMYPAESCGNYVSIEALYHMRKQMTNERDRDIEALRREMAKEKEAEREYFQNEMKLHEQHLTKEVETVKQKYQDDFESYLDASVDRIIGTKSEGNSKDESIGSAKKAFNTLFLKR
ncbi:amiloride-sensitive sodium channel subunit beta-like [Palaemon carinicauda]|uniref:amiloride-sensitive sodium channel subunit beta-like n=1 Tax=Palaemon carinicauda TaxID=392227 RepID=UPI0035B610D0